MPFAIQYLSLLEKYENISTNFKQKTVTSYFGTVTPNHDIESVVHQFNSNEDYGEPTDIEFSVEDNDYYYDNYETSILKVNPLINLNASFESYLKDCFPDVTDTSHFKSIIDVEPLLATFYLSAIEYVERLADQEYSDIKAKYPNQSFYPIFSITLSDVAHYESSKCW